MILNVSCFFRQIFLKVRKIKTRQKFSKLFNGAVIVTQHLIFKMTDYLVVVDSYCEQYSLDVLNSNMHHHCK